MPLTGCRGGRFSLCACDLERRGIPPPEPRRCRRFGSMPMRFNAVARGHGTWSSSALPLLAVPHPRPMRCAPANRAPLPLSPCPSSVPARGTPPLSVSVAVGCLRRGIPAFKRAAALRIEAAMSALASAPRVRACRCVLLPGRARPRIVGPGERGESLCATLASCRICSAFTVPGFIRSTTASLVVQHAHEASAQGLDGVARGQLRGSSIRCRRHAACASCARGPGRCWRASWNGSSRRPLGRAPRPLRGPTTRCAGLIPRSTYAYPAASRCSSV